MPYNTRRKSLSLPSLGIHIPVTQAARAAAAARASQSSASPSNSSTTTQTRPDSPESHPNKRTKRSHSASVSSQLPTIERTPPPSPKSGSNQKPEANKEPQKVAIETINDDIVEATVLQLEATGNRPHLIKELALILTQTLASVQNSANQCAIISSRLASYMKRPCWSTSSPCPLAKELETVHPRRTYYFLTTQSRQPLPDSNAILRAIREAAITPSVSLTSDSGSDDIESRRRELSPSPEVDLSPAEFDDFDDDIAMPATPLGSLPRSYPRPFYGIKNDSPPLEKEEREFTQTADFLQKRKLSEASPSELPDRNHPIDYSCRDDTWFSDSRSLASATFLTSPLIKPSIPSSGRKDEEAESWTKLNSLIEWDRGAESIEIDELDCLLDMY